MKVLLSLAGFACFGASVVIDWRYLRQDISKLRPPPLKSWGTAFGALALICFALAQWW